MCVENAAHGHITSRLLAIKNAVVLRCAGDKRYCDHG